MLAYNRQRHARRILGRMVDGIRGGNIIARILVIRQQEAILRIHGKSRVVGRLH